MTIGVKFTLNGKQVTLQVGATEILTDTLRDRLGLTGTKKACGTGDCGACTIILDGEAVRSCILLTGTVDGKNIVTIEGVGSTDVPHPLQQAFVDAGAVQCGYCMPGMILTAKALLDKCPNPNEAQIKEAISGNLCRCTGYTKIIKAVKAAAQPK
jgi:aerobic-type carbon monoxide dehydrogenase small subunit (CoxS/CutS family)